MSFDFELSDEQQTIRESIRRIISDFDETYWLEHDRTGDFPSEFRQAVAEGGWLGIAMPEEVGGAGLGVTEATVMMEAIANSPGGMGAASAVHINIFGPHVLVAHGSEEQRRTHLPPIIRGETTSPMWPPAERPSTSPILSANSAASTWPLEVSRANAAERRFKEKRPPAACSSPAGDSSACSLPLLSSAMRVMIGLARTRQQEHSKWSVLAVKPLSTADRSRVTDLMSTFQTPALTRR